MTCIEDEIANAEFIASMSTSPSSRIDKLLIDTGSIGMKESFGLYCNESYISSR
jgi:hypothetical protein